MRNVLHRLKDADKACLLVPAMGAAVTVLEVMAPLVLWPPLCFTLTGLMTRVQALSPMPTWLREHSAVLLDALWSWHGAAMLFLLNTCMFAAVFLFAVWMLGRDAPKGGVP